MANFLSDNNSFVLDQRKIAYPYLVTTPACEKPITPQEVKSFLKTTGCDCADDDGIINIMIDAMIEIGEAYTGRDFITKTYTTYRDNLFEPIQLRKSKVTEIVSFQYFLDGVLTTIDPSVYSFQNTHDYPFIIVSNNKALPLDCDNIPQSVKIVFKAGYGDSTSPDGWRVPAGIKLAILNQISAYYANRGDSASDFNGANAPNLPDNARALYQPFKMITVGDFIRNPPYFRGNDA